MTPLVKPEPDTSPPHTQTSHSGETTAGLPEATPPAAHGFGPPVAPGELGRLGHYRVLRVLGRGGMGAIYLASDERLGREVALKVMLPEAAAVPTARERFLREARAAACIEHDNVVAIHHVGEESGVPFIVMPLLKGETLADRLKHEGRLTVAESLRVGREIALGLAAAHARGLVHRDVKPANIWLEAVTGRVKVLDFGLARPDDPDLPHLTSSGTVMGTPAYMAPEQAAGDAIDHRADLFSLGCVLYEVATGRRPFGAPTVIAVLTKIATHTPPPAATIAEVPLALSDLIQRLLAKHPAGRPRSAAGVAELLRAPGGPESAVTQTLVAYIPAAPDPWTALDLAPPAPRSARVAPPRPPRRWKVAAAGMAGLLAVAFAGVIVLKVKRPDGSETTVELPDGATAKVDAKGNVEVTLPKAAPAAAVAVAVAVALPGGRSPMDALERSAIPARELAIAGEGDPANAPAELVGIIGTSGMNHWRNVIYAGFRDGDKTLVTASRDGLVRWWDVPTKTLKRSVTVPGLVGCGWVTAGGFDLSPDGKLAVMLEDNERIRLRRTDTFALVKEVPCIGYVKFSPDGKTVALVGYKQSSVQLLDVETLTLRELTPERPEGADIWRSRPDFSPDGTAIAWASTENKVSQWHLHDVNSGKQRQKISPHEGQWQIAWHPQGKVILGTTHDRTAIWDVDNGKLSNVSATGREHGCSVTGDGRHIIDGGFFNVIIREWGKWDVSGVSCAESLRFRVEAVAVSPGGDLVTAGDDIGGVCLLRLPGRESIQEGSGQWSNVPVLVTPNGRQVVRVAGDKIEWFEVSGQGWVERGRLGAGGLWGDGAFSRDGLRAAGVPSAGKVRVFNLSAQTQLCELDVPKAEYIHTGSMTPTGDAVFVQRGDRSYVCVEIPSGKPLIELPAPPESEGTAYVGGLAVSPDGRWLVTATNLLGKVTVWDRATGKTNRELKPVQTDDTNTHRNLKFAPDGRRLLCLSSRHTYGESWTYGRLEAWDTTNWKQTLTLSVSNYAGGLGLALRADSRQAAWPLSDGQVRLVNLDTGAVERTIRVGPPGGVIPDCAYAPDGRHLVTANANGTAYVLRLAPPPDAKK